MEARLLARSAEGGFELLKSLPGYAKSKGLSGAHINFTDIDVSVGAATGLSMTSSSFFAFDFHRSISCFALSFIHRFSQFMTF